jgi:hypothetical protein
MNCSIIVSYYVLSLMIFECTLMKEQLFIHSYIDLYLIIGKLFTDAQTGGLMLFVQNIRIGEGYTIFIVFLF